VGLAGIDRGLRSGWLILGDFLTKRPRGGVNDRVEVNKTGSNREVTGLAIIMRREHLA
jgi:hypothetical protein